MTARAHDIAIVGMAGRFPGAPSVEALWSRVRDGLHSIVTFTDEELRASGVPDSDLANPHYVRAGAVLDDVERFDAAVFGITPRDAALMDPQQRQFLEVCWAALEHAGYAPTRLSEPVGVFGGSRTNTYLLQLAQDAELVERAGAFHIGLGNDLAFLTTRVSHALNLTGPSCSIHTACSTALVAIHLAAQSLRDGECRMALAGGVAVNVPHRCGYLAEEGGVQSPDGCCRVFDASARGTLFGSGVGVVVLKRLVDAVADRDYVHAVIKGSAVNNDGASKASFTAPTVKGQAAVIRDALRVADVPADSIGYVEAHGTGTLLGDAIELRALTKVYRESTTRSQYCAIGSIKSNLGHLDAAAGVAGLIKVVECLKHRTLVPSLHFEQANPQVDFMRTPFRVNTETRPWESVAPRRAAVSAFGVGGTNAHVVVEEAPIRVAVDDEPEQLLVWSGRTPEALSAIERGLAAHLASAPDLRLADVAFTLQRGRSAMAWRRAVVCRDRAEAIDALRDGRCDADNEGDPGDPSVVFVFAGQGAQYAGMGREIYEREPAYRDAIDRCATLLAPWIGCDLRDVLHGEGDGRIDETIFAQPAIFATEYALATLWMSWGIQPAAMIGHSLGEYAAACLSGVLSLEDALRLIAARGRTMQAMPRGAMIAVEMGAAAAAAWLGVDLWLSASNAADRCTIGGPEEAIADLQERLRRAGCSAHRLSTSHAYHTAMMDPAVDAFVREVDGVQFGPARIPCVSSVTGTWIGSREWQDPLYWARQLREPVQFHRGIETLLADDRLFVEVGPGQGLTAVLKRWPGVRAVPSCARRGASDIAALLRALARLWTAGVEVDWDGVHTRERRGRVPLPTYPFQGQHHWIDPQARRRETPAAAPRRAKIADTSKWFWSPSWRLTPHPPSAGEISRSDQCWLVLGGDDWLTRALTGTLRSAGADVILANAATEWASPGGTTFSVDPAQPQHYDRLFDALDEAGRQVTHLLHLWGASSRADGLDSLLHLLQRVVKRGDLTEWCVVSSETEAIESEDRISADKSGASVFCKVLAQETSIRTRFIDLPADSAIRDRQEIAARLAGELASPAPDPIVAYRGQRRWTAGFERVRLPQSQPFPLRRRGVYLITGGLGSVGLIIAKYFASRVGARVALVGRTPLPDRPQWPAIVAGATGAPDELVARISNLQEIEAAGGELLILRADVSDAPSLRSAIARCRTHFGELHGVVHAAGITSGPTLFRVARETTPDDCRLQLIPKLGGLRALEAVLRDTPVDFVLAMSSNAAVLGGLGFLSYAAANAAMDAFVRDRAGRDATRWLSANWDHWPEETRKYRDVRTSMDEYAMTREEAEEALDAVLTRCHGGQVIVSTGDLEARAALWLDAAPGAASRPGPGAVGSAQPRPKLRTPFEPPRTAIEERIAAVWQEFLGVTPIGRADDFFELGGHSLMATKIVGEMSRRLGVEVTLRSLFEGPTVAALAEAAARAVDGTAAPVSS